MEKTAKRNSVTNSIMDIRICKIYDNLICPILQKILLPDYLSIICYKLVHLLWHVNMYAESICCLPTFKLTQLQELSFILLYRHRKCLCTRNSDVHKNWILRHVLWATKCFMFTAHCVGYLNAIVEWNHLL